ncbi:MAG: hypothetical protein IJA32_09115 [Lachnospiraceae bacterium]|nr:hypothetical protein [Lachnospiraceae bacterium]
MNLYNKFLTSQLKKLEASQKEGNLSKIAKQYFKVGKTYKKMKNAEKAIYYLERFDNLVGGDDELYDKFTKKDDKAMDWVIDLQIEHPPITKHIRKEVEEKAATLSIIQKAQWNLLTLARCTVLFHKFSKLSVFRVFAQYQTVLHMLMKGIYGHQEEVNMDLLFSFCDELEDIFDSINSVDNRNKVNITGGADFVVTDLESDEGTYHLTMVLDDLRMIACGENVDELNGNFVPNALFSDYYIRTQDQSLENVPWIQKEQERIWADFNFIKSCPQEQAFADQMAEYMKFSMPQI